MLADYLQAQIPSPVRILGVALRPYSLGHDLILRRFQSPFLSDEPKGDVAALLFGLFVCSRTYEQCLADFDVPGKLEAFCSDLGEKKMEWTPDDEICNLYEYVVEGSRQPRVWVRERKGDNGAHSPGSPFLAMVKMIMLTKFGMTETEVLNRPLRLTLYDFAVWAEMEGLHRIYSDDDAARKAAVEDYLREHPDFDDPELPAKMEAWVKSQSNEPAAPTGGLQAWPEPAGQGKDTPEKADAL